MVLSRVELDLTRRETMKALASPQRFHGAVEQAFPGERRRRLWRLDRLGGVLYLLILSEDAPDLRGIVQQFGPLTGVDTARTRDYAPLLERVTNGSTWRFRLTANPTKSCLSPDTAGKRGTVRAHCTVEHQKQWLMERAQKHGFELQEDAFTVTSQQWLQFTKGGTKGKKVTLLSVTFEGVLQVCDAELFRKTLAEGIGRGKAYGQGLLTVMRAGPFNG